MTARSELPPAHAIAVVGMAGRFPRADTVSALWENMLAGREGITFFREDELDASIPEALRRNPAYVRAKGVLADCDRFDAAFFGMTPLEAQLMDPQHRVLLELSWAALEASGFAPSAPPGRVGVYVGANWNRYRTHCVATHPDVVANFGELNTALANEQDFLATRISYKLGLRGPSCTLSTACSTSLVAIVQAARALADGECDLALAGGVSVSVPLQVGYLHDAGGMLSKDGHTRPFDAEGTGTTFNDGAGVVVLRRLADALAAGDHVHAVIRGHAVNNDGSDKVSFTAPSVAGQTDVLRAALEHAGVHPATIGYVETHGTATPLGDPIEFAALMRAYGGAGTAHRACAIGSVKSSVGHLVHAAGVTGFIVAVLAVEKGVVPPTLFFRAANPRLSMERSRFYVPTTPRQWREVGQPRRAGVSSFGVGGTNAHVVLEQAPTAPPATDNAHEGPHVLCLSAKSEGALKRQVDAIQERATAPARELTLASLAHGLQINRVAMPHRMAVAAESLADAAAALRDPRRRSEGNGSRPRSVAFLLPGLGSERAGMGRLLFEHVSVFRRRVEDGIQQVLAWGGPDLRPALCGDPAGAMPGLADVRVAMPALFLFECALVETLEHLGLAAEVLIGCSLGELTAAVAAGVLSFQSALRVVIAGANAAWRSPPGAMITACCTEREALSLATDGVALAAVHGPDSVVLSGAPEAIAQARERLESRGVRVSASLADRAYHSALLEPAADALERALRDVALSAPQRRIISTLTGRELTAEEATDPRHWAGVLCRQVRLVDALDQLGGDGEHLLVEAGPGTGLTAMALQHPRASTGLPIAALPGSGLAATTLVELGQAVAHVWANGGDVRFARRWGSSAPRRVALPTYPFERTRHWLEPQARQPVVPVPTQAAPAAPSQGADAIRARVAKIVEDASGLNVDMESESHWAEFGFDSLVVTQIAIGVRTAFDVDLGFRELMERHTSPRRLVQWLLARTPAAAPSGSAVALATGAAVAAEGGARAPSPGARIERSVSAAYQLNEEQRAWLDAFVDAYTKATAGSKQLAQRHRRHLADPRTVSGFHPVWKEIVYPIVTERSSGSRLWDVDGREYVDFLNGFGCIFFGHSPAFVTEAVREQLGKGIEIGPQSALAGEVADRFCQLTGNERVSFSNTGSEAVRAALRIARTVTGREKVVTFEGSYHGIFDEVVVRAGPKGMALPGSPGIPRSRVGEIVILPYGTDEALKEIERLGKDLAAVLVEPVQSRRPDLQPVAFLKRLREVTKANGTALILDEVVTGFRVHPGGIQALFDVRADIATYGKVVAGGYPVGIVAGRAQFLDALDGGFWSFGDESVPEVGVTFFAGTFVRHPMVLAAMRAVLRRLAEAGPSLQADLGQRTSAMIGDIKAFLAAIGARIKIESFSSYFYVSAPPGEIWSSLLFAWLRLQGIHIWEHFPCFLTTSHSDEDIERFKTKFCEGVAALVRLGFLTGTVPNTAAPVEPRLLAPARNGPTSG